MNQTAESVAAADHFLAPSALDRAFSKVFNLVIDLGGGLVHNHVLEVVGRKSGKRYRTPVNLMEHDGARYLVAPRGHTAWVKNARVAGEVTLQRGRTRTRYALQPVSQRERPALLKEYLSRYALTVQGYFSVTPDAPLDDFARVAAQHPVFELHALD